LAANPTANDAVVEAARDVRSGRGAETRLSRLPGRRQGASVDIDVPQRLSVDAALAERLIAAQFPRWAGLPVRPVDRAGWDNYTFRLGADMLVRLPSAAPYALAVEKEQRWLPTLARQLPLPIPVPLAAGRPGEGYPHPWSVYQWIDGSPAEVPLDACVPALTDFLLALRDIDPTGGPGPGRHNWHRGGPLETYDPEVRSAVDGIGDPDRRARITESWETSLRARWTGRPVWFHGDVAPGNLLTRDGALSAVIDFGTCGVGDPACDLAIAWTSLTPAGRDLFRERMRIDAATWLRGRGWALWKALITADQPVVDRILTES
jgi:aminoglycoside phosphotransferase (APT) family kinase protein